VKECASPLPTSSSSPSVPQPPANYFTFLPRYRIVLTAGQLILKQGGVIRDISNWGIFHLPRAVSLHQTRYTKGHYFVMRYDAGIRTHQDVTKTLRVDPRVIRAGGVKLGDGKLETLSKFGAVQWKNME
jgi:small subunit ribosomal protein S6